MNDILDFGLGLGLGLVNIAHIYPDLYLQNIFPCLHFSGTNSGQLGGQSTMSVSIKPDANIQ